MDTDLRKRITGTGPELEFRKADIPTAIRNAKRFGFKTPCAIKGDRCYDCSSPDRICNKLEICMKKGKVMEEEIILIDEALGY